MLQLPDFVLASYVADHKRKAFVQMEKHHKLDKQLLVVEDYHLTPELSSKAIAILDKLEVEIQSFLSKTVSPNDTTPASTSISQSTPTHERSESKQTKQ